MKTLTYLVVATFLTLAAVTPAFAGAIPLSDQEMEEMMAGQLVVLNLPLDLAALDLVVAINNALNLVNVVQNNINVCAICIGGGGGDQTNAAAIGQFNLQGIGTIF